MKFKIAFLLFFVFYISQAVTLFSQERTSDEKKQYYIDAKITDENKLKVFNNLWETINRSYFDSTFNGNDWTKIREIYQPQVLQAKNKLDLIEILNRMVGELKTSHLRVTSKIKMRGKSLNEIFGEKVDEKKNSIHFGYGTILKNIDNQKVVAKVENLDNARAGVKIGWIEKSCEYVPLSKEVDDSLVFSESAKCLYLTENGENKTITLNKSWFLSPLSKQYRQSEFITEDIFYLKFTEFDKGLGKWLSQQVLANSKAKTIIIDLRDNFGGYVDEVKSSLTAIFPKKTLIGEFIERDLAEKNFFVGSDNYYKGKVVVLINGSSHSGAEIFAKSIQELERGKIIGQTSGGQVLNSFSKNLSNGFELQIAYRDYKTSKGYKIEGKGVMPDISIPFSIEDFRNPKDVILEKTLEYLLKNEF